MNRLEAVLSLMKRVLETHTLSLSLASLRLGKHMNHDGAVWRPNLLHVCVRIHTLFATVTCRTFDTTLNSGSSMLHTVSYELHRYE